MPKEDDKAASGNHAGDKGNNSAERAARKAANIAEREARKAARQAERQGKSAAANGPEKAKKKAAGKAGKERVKDLAKAGAKAGAKGGKNAAAKAGGQAAAKGQGGAKPDAAAKAAERQARQDERKSMRQQKAAAKPDAGPAPADDAAEPKADAGKADEGKADEGKAPAAAKTRARAKSKDAAAGGSEAPVAVAPPPRPAKAVLVEGDAPVSVPPTVSPTGRPPAPSAASANGPTPAPVSVSARPAGSVGEFKVPPFSILIVAQAGRLARQAVMFAASLRRYAPNFEGRLVVAEPQPEEAWAGTDTRIPDQERALLTEFGAEIIPFTARHFGRSYPYGNKIEALAILPPKQPFIFFDTDTLVLGPIDEIAFRFRRPSASMKREGTWPEPPLYGPDYAEIWESLFSRFGLRLAGSVDNSFPNDYWEHYLYFNAGWFFGADPAEFGKRFLDAAVRVRDEPGEALASQSLDPWLDQAVLPLVIHSLGGGRPGPELAGLDGDMTCHYRKLSLLYARESDAAIDAFETIAAEPRIAALFAKDKAFQRLVTGGEGRAKIRPLFAEGLPSGEKALRHILKKADLWLAD